MSYDCKFIILFVIYDIFSYILLFTDIIILVRDNMVCIVLLYYGCVAKCLYTLFHK